MIEIKDSSEGKKMKIDINKSVDELHLQLSFVKKRIQELVDEFISKTDHSLESLRQSSPDAKDIKKGIESTRRSVKKTAKNLEESVENLIDEWKKEVKEDIRNPNRYDS